MRKNCTFSKNLQQVKSFFFFASIYHSPFQKNIKLKALLDSLNFLWVPVLMEQATNLT
jgi:hypothetical protein